MTATVLLLDALNDSATLYTSAWANSLHDELLRKKHTCIRLNVEPLCHSGSILQDAIDRADFVVFYGHGLATQWNGLPAGAGKVASALVSMNTVNMLNGRSIYAGCCDSLAQLGHAYHKMYPNGAYVGYSHAFKFEYNNHQEFGDLVNSSVIGYITGDPASKVAADLRTEWDNLRHAFSSGRLKNRPDAVFAAQCADDNAKSVGSLP